MRELVMVGTGDATTEFFDGLAGRGYEPLVRKLSGSVRFEIADATRRAQDVTINKGQISPSLGGAPRARPSSVPIARFSTGSRRAS